MTEEVIKKIKDSIVEQKAIYEKYHNWEQDAKIFVNSLYGGLANPYMYFFNVDLAECITKQGKNAILYAESHINDYFKNCWHKDFETHRKMGVKVNGQVKKQVTVYIDTDSVSADTLIDLSEEMISVESQSGTKIYYPDDKIKVLRNDAEIEILARDLLETDYIWQE